MSQPLESVPPPTSGGAPPPPELDVDRLIADHWESQCSNGELRWIINTYRSRGQITLRQLVPDEIRAGIRREVLELLEANAERRDLALATSGGTPRHMSVVRSETIAAHGGLIREVYGSRALNTILARLAGEPLFPCPSKDEEFLITRQEKKGDTHGWHWGDFSFALIWIIETPPIDYGGMLQCVAHTQWNKEDAQVHQYLIHNPIHTYGFETGDLYFLRTDTTLHRTVPLNRDATRIILNMTWASQGDLDRGLHGDDRWWENAEVSAAQRPAD